MLNGYIFRRKYCGTHDVEWAYKFRKLCRTKFGSRAQVFLYGRGPRWITFDNGTKRHYPQTLPVKFAKKCAIYLNLRGL